MTEKYSKQEITEKIVGVIADILDRTTEEISSNMGVFSDLGIESVEIMEIAFMLEQEFDIKIEDDELWNLPKYFLETEMFKDEIFSKKAIYIIKNNFSEISDEDISKFKSTNALLENLVVQDIVNCILKKS